MTIYVTNGLNTVETVVLAKNNDGLKDLYQLSSKIKMNSMENVSFELLQQFSSNLIIIFKMFQTNIVTLFKFLIRMKIRI